MVNRVTTKKIEDHVPVELTTSAKSRLPEALKAREDRRKGGPVAAGKSTTKRRNSRLDEIMRTVRKNN